MAGNTNLGAARAAKNDEFYTQWNDIENEMQSYLEYDPDVFRGKVVLLPCDDPEASNFTKYFALNFNKLGLKKLISTSYAPCRKGRIYVTEQGANLNDGVNLSGECLKWDYLEGDGDFRSDEVTALRDEADIVATNPPYSLFREFVPWLAEGDVEFAVIGNFNSITYREIFPLIKDDKMWLGQPVPRGSMWFTIPDNMAGSISKRDKTCFRIEDGQAQARRPACWFTNIEHSRRHEPLRLMSMKENQKYNKQIIANVNSYKQYDNYDAIEVPVVAGIPSDYAGVMGVPISFLDKYSPDQFEILGCSYDYGRPEGWSEDVKMSPSVNGQNIYKRILIRHRNPERKAPQSLSRSRSE